jgi:WD40 repeat protein
MGVFDASQEAQVLEEDEDGEEVHAPPVISAFKTHSRTISSFLFSTTEANSVFTSSYDSSIRKLDLAKGTSVEIYAPDDPSVDTPVSALDMSASDPHTLLFSTLQGDVGRYDMRTEPSTADVWSLSDQKIGGFSMHPLQAHLIATASLDRTLKIWDLRKMQGSGANRHPALLGEHESRLSVSHASWSRGGRIATSSYDDTVKIHDFSSSCSSPPSNAATWPVGHDISDAAMQPAHTIKHNNQTGRWVTILKPQWQLRPRDGIDKLAIGNMNRFVDVFAADGEQLAQLEGEGITAVPAVAHFHPSMDWVAGGSASGKLALWM